MGININPPIITILYLIGVGLNWWSFNWEIGLVSIIIDIMFTASDKSVNS